jgi:osmotically-inducible protein OsmY
MTRPEALVLVTPIENGDDDHMEGTAHRVAEILEDIRLAETVDRAMQETGYLHFRDIRISVSGRVVILKGRVPSYNLKLLAQNAALGVLGVEALHNELEVVTQEPD